MLAVVFLNPVFLGALPLAALPIVIHLLSRRQFRRIEWAATRFLLEAEKQNRRRVRFEQWLLVALRCLILGLLALMMARPFVRPGVVSSLLGGRGDVHRILVLDDSASLAHRGGAAQDFATLRNATERLIDWMRQEAPSDSISLYITSQPKKPILEAAHAAEAAGDEWRSQLARLRPTDAAAHPAQVLANIATFLGDARGPAELYLLSDFQRTDWLAGGDPFEPVRKYADSLRVVAIAATATARENTGVIDLSLARPQTLAGVPTLATARLANYTRRALRDVRLEVEVDGVPQPGGALDALEPGQARDVGLEVTFPEHGRHELAVRLAASDVFAVDDLRRIAVTVKPELRVLLVNGQPSSDPLKDEAQLPRNALAPPGPFSSGIRVEITDPAQLEVAALAATDCVVLCNVAAPAESTAAVLRRHVETGGGLLIFLGDEIGDAADYNRTLGPTGANLLPFPLAGPPLRSPTPTGVGLIRVGEHPVTAAFSSGQEGASEYVHFRSYYGVLEKAGENAATEPTSQPTASVLARYTDPGGTPALAEKALGRGRVLLFTSTIDLDWNDWARAVDGSYVVALLESVQYLSRRNADQPSFVAGDSIALHASLEEFEPPVTIRPPGHPDEPAVETRLVEAAQADELARAEGPVALRAGTYRFELTSRTAGRSEQPVCVNPDSAESDLGSAAAAELDAALAALPHQVLLASDAFDEQHQQTRRELWPMLLVVAVVCLMAEQALAWRFGRPLSATRVRTRSVTAAAAGLR
ncbi:MAG: BatA domain-containing protein [Planctomycetes bacterium]|nr:BatA domain-containing protein [Planctomycetota bacterium]